MKPPSRPRADLRLVNGVPTHARVWGAGPPLVIVPGLGCAAFCYDRLARALAPRFEVWAYDPPGHGRSGNWRSGDPPHPDVRLQDFTDHLAAWMDAARLRGALVVGHSMGGEVAIDLAARYPAHPALLALLAPTGLPDNPNVALQMLRLLADAPREPLGLIARVLPAYLRTGPRRMLRAAQDQRAHQTAPLLRLVRAPVLVLGGTRDSVISSRAIRTLCQYLPNARVGWVKGAHAFHYPSAREVARLIVAFAREFPPARRSATLTS